LIQSVQITWIWHFLRFFLVLMTFFPVLRVAIIGTENASGVFEYLIAAIPDLMIIGCISYLIFQIRNNVFNIFNNRSDVIVLFIAGINLFIGCLLSGDPKLIILGVRLSYIPILFYFISRFIASENFREKFEEWLHQVMAWFSLIALTGFVLYYFFPSADISFNNWVGGQQGAYFIRRMNSLFFSPTVNGMYCCIGALYFLQNSLRKFSFINVFCLLLNFWCLLMTVSRGGIIAFAMILPLVCIICFDWKKVSAVIALMTIIFFMALYSVGLSLSNFSWVFTSAAETIGLEENVSRVELWKRTFEDLKEKPFGYGIGKSGWIAYRFLKGTDTKSAYLATDGWYLKIANETGIFGLISFLVLFAYFLFRMLAGSTTDQTRLFLLLMFLAVLMVNLVSNVLDYFLFNSLFWFYAGASENLKSSNKSAIE
jgi:O-antigen ligase